MVGNPEAAAQLYQTSSRSVAKVLGPTMDFPTCSSSKGTGNPQESDFEGQQDLIIELPQDCGNRDSWWAQTKPCVHLDRGERAVTPQDTEPDIIYYFLYIIFVKEEFHLIENQCQMN